MEGYLINTQSIRIRSKHREAAEVEFQELKRNLQAEQQARRGRRVASRGAFWERWCDVCFSSQPSLFVFFNGR